MTRGKSTTLSTVCPPSFGSFEQSIDKRSRPYRIWKAKVAQKLADKGGPDLLSSTELFALKNEAFAEVVIEAGMVDFLSHKPLEWGRHSQMLITWISCAKLLGVGRRARAVRAKDIVAEYQEAPRPS
jgi:hypothetical protein